MNNDNKRKARGVGGVLFFCLCLVGFGPSHTIQDVLKTWQELKPGIFPVVRQLIVIDTIVALVVMLYGIIVGILIWKGSPGGRRLAQQYLVVRILVALVTGAIPLIWAYRQFGARAAQVLSTALMPQRLLEIAVCLLWLAYFVWSRRVREAYSTP